MCLGKRSTVLLRLRSSLLGPPQAWQAAPSGFLMRRVVVVILEGWGMACRFAELYGYSLYSTYYQTVKSGQGRWHLWVAFTAGWLLTADGRNDVERQGVILACNEHSMKMLCSLGPVPK